VGADGYCFAHSPSREQERQAVRRRGGANSATSARLHALVPPKLISVYERLELALDEVRSGAITPQQAQAMASLGRALVSVLTAGETEERLRALERKVQEGAA
jgi:hypothetical protein